MCILNCWTGYVSRVNSATVFDVILSTYNVLFSIMKRLLTMIQQLYINSATVSKKRANTRKFDFCVCTRVTRVFLCFARVSRLSCGWFVLYVYILLQALHTLGHHAYNIYVLILGKIRTFSSVIITQ